MAYIVSRSAVVPVEYDDPSSYYYMTLHVPYPPEFQAGDLLVAVFMWGNSNCPNVPGYTQLGYRETGVGAVVDQITFQWRIADGSESDAILPIFSASIAGTEPDPPGRPALGFTMAIRNADTSVLADYRAPGDLNAFWWRAVGAIANATTPGATSPLAIPGLSPGPAPALFMTAGIIESWEQIVDPEYGISIPAKARFGATPYVGPATEQLVLQGSYQRSNVNDSANPADWKSYYAAGFWTGYSSGGDIPSGALYVDPNGDQEATAGACLFALKAGLCIKPFTVSGGAATLSGYRKSGETVSLAATNGVSIGSVSYPDDYTWQADASGIAAGKTVLSASASGGQAAEYTIDIPIDGGASDGTTSSDSNAAQVRSPSNAAVADSDSSSDSNVCRLIVPASVAAPFLLAASLLVAVLYDTATADTGSFADAVAISQPASQTDTSTGADLSVIGLGVPVSDSSSSLDAASASVGRFSATTDATTTADSEADTLTFRDSAADSSVQSDATACELVFPETIDVSDTTSSADETRIVAAIGQSDASAQSDIAYGYLGQFASASDTTSSIDGVGTSITTGVWVPPAKAPRIKLALGGPVIRLRSAAPEIDVSHAGGPLIRLSLLEER